MNPEMNTSETRVPPQGVAKIFEAGLKSKTWDIHGMPHFITTTHCEGCDMCEAYTLHVIEASKALMVEIPPREVEKAFWITWPNIVCHIEDEASSESDKKVEWYSVRVLHFIKVLTDHNRTLTRYIWYQQCSKMTVVMFYDKEYSCLSNYSHTHVCDDYYTNCT